MTWKTYPAPEFKVGDDVTGVVMRKGEYRLADELVHGVHVDLGHYRGFVPQSQIALNPPKELSQLIGSKLTCEVLRISQEGGKWVIILSPRQVRRRTRIRELGIGAVLQGTVYHVIEQGAFIDIGDVLGMLHVSDMIPSSIPPTKKLEVGMELNVVVLNIDNDELKVAVGMHTGNSVDQSDPDDG